MCAGYEPTEVIRAASHYADPTGTQDTEAESQGALKARAMEPLVFPTTGDDIDAAVAKCILVGDFTTAVRICLQQGRMSDAFVMGIAGG